MPRASTGPFAPCWLRHCTRSMCPRSWSISCGWSMHLSESPRSRVWRRSIQQVWYFVGTVFWQFCDDLHMQLKARILHVGSGIAVAMCLTTQDSFQCFFASRCCNMSQCLGSHHWIWAAPPADATSSGQTTWLKHWANYVNSLNWPTLSRRSCPQSQVPSPVQHGVSHSTWCHMLYNRAIVQGCAM